MAIVKLVNQARQMLEILDQQERGKAYDHPDGYCGVYDGCTASASSVCYVASECDPPTCGPATTCFWNSDHVLGACGRFWSSTMDESTTGQAWCLRFYEGNISQDAVTNDSAVRCVADMY